MSKPGIGRRAALLLIVVNFVFQAASAATLLPNHSQSTTGSRANALPGAIHTARVGRAFPAAASTTLLNESFTSTATTPNTWKSFGDACLTAGTTTTPATSVPACGATAAQNAAGAGTLQLTQNVASHSGMVVNNTPLSTANGLQITFTDYAFNGTTPGSEGVAFFLTDASKALPTQAGQGGGGLGYAGTTTGAGLANGYVGVGFDEYGGYSSTFGGFTGGPGNVPETIAVRGSATTNYQYIGGVVNAAGTAASLPFAFDQPTVTTRPATAPTINATLTAAGALSVAIDRHDGNGFVTYYTHTIVGVNGQPAVPANVYFGLSSSTGAHHQVHQISGLTVSTIGSATGATSLTESFTGVATTPSTWAAFGDACLTAGTTTTPATSVPACGATAAQNAAGAGTLQLTQNVASHSGMVVNNTPLSTANGLQITFTDYAFNGTTPGSEGVAFFLTDASKALPTQAGQGGGGLGYAGTTTGAGLANGYVGVGFDEYGGYSSTFGGFTGGPGNVPETIAVRGSATTNYQYIGGVVNAAGTAASLPFAFDQPTVTTRPATAPTIQATLTAAGALSVAIDRHDGNGFVTYYTHTIVGVNGQPAVPAKVYFGLSSSTGAHHQVHQISGLTVNTVGTVTGATPLASPPQIVSAGGALTFNVSAQSDKVTGNPEFLYNGSTVPPTLRLVPGDTLTVNFTNNLPTPPAGAGYTNIANLHYHGLHVSPQAPSDDSIDMLANPGQTLHYVVQIPTTHPPGLYWYHTHAHGETERDTLSGMSGALIIDGIASYTPAVTNLPELVLIARDTVLPGGVLPDAKPEALYAMRWAMQHGVAMHSGSATQGTTRSEYHATSNAKTRNPFVAVDPNFRRFVRPSAADTHCVAATPEAAVHGLTLNGQTQPSIRIAPGESQFWRVVNAGADTYLDLQVDNTNMQIIALDGIPLISGVGTPAAMTVSHWVLPPGSRVEFIITGPPAGTTASLRTNCFDSGSAGAPMPAAVLASINPAAATAAVRRGGAARISASAVRFRYHTTATRTTSLHRAGIGSLAGIRATAVSATRTLYYSDQNNINGVAYDPAAPPMFYSQTGTVEEWTIVNNSSQVHTFHIHQVHFVVEAINGTTQAQQFLMDNVNVPAATASGAGSVKILLDFTDPVIIGTFLLHCHILSHEDAGMMAKIRIGTAPPLSLSATNVTFANVNAGVQTVTITGGATPYSLTGCTGVASAAVNGAKISILPAGVGACVLTVADSSAPSITATIAIQVNAAAAVVALAPTSVSFAAPTAAAQKVAISGGTTPYSVTGCTNVATGQIAGTVLTVTPQATGTCSLVVSDANNNQATLAVTVNATVSGNPLDNLTFHQNPARTGWYQNETILTAANVAAGTFGQIATLTAPTGSTSFGKVYAQPLFVTNEAAVDGKQHNLVIIAGAADQIYAFDETTRAVVWHRDFTNAAAGVRQQLWSDSGCSDVNPDDGIVGTPVIDRARDTLYVVVATMENGVGYTRLHAIGLGNGTDSIAPTVISGSVTLATGGIASIHSVNNMNRSALLEADGNIYVGLSSHCDSDTANAHGWVIAYSASTLAETGNLVDITNANAGSGYYLGAVWMSGFGPAADAQGNIYFATGNGPFNGTTNFGMSVMKLPGNLNLGAVSYFTPIQESADSTADADLGAGGVMVLPDQTGTLTHLLVAGGKCSANSVGCFKYILNRDSLGGQTSGNAGAVWSGATGGGIWGGPAYFVDSTGLQHIVEGGTPSLNTYNLGVSPASLTVQSSTNIGCLECRESGGSQPVVSSNGTQAGTAVVWALKTPGNSGGNITLYAFGALKMGTPLFSAVAGTWTQTAGTSWIGGALVSPLVVDGRVYVPTDGAVSVFGLK